MHPRWETTGRTYVNRRGEGTEGNGKSELRRANATNAISNIRNSSMIHVFVAPYVSFFDFSCFQYAWIDDIFTIDPVANSRRWVANYRSSRSFREHAVCTPSVLSPSVYSFFNPPLLVSTWVISGVAKERSSEKNTILIPRQIRKKEYEFAILVSRLEFLAISIASKAM